MDHFFWLSCDLFITLFAKRFGCTPYFAGEENEEVYYRTRSAVAPCCTGKLIYMMFSKKSGGFEKIAPNR